MRRAAGILFTAPNIIRPLPKSGFPSEARSGSAGASPSPSLIAAQQPVEIAV